MVLKGTVFMKRYNKVMVCMSFLLVSALVGCSQKDIENPSDVTSAINSNDTLQLNQLTENSEQTLSIIHEGVDVLYYENGYPYIHDILTNNADNTITETEYCMLAYDIDGMPLKLYWNFLDSSAECSYDYVVRTENINLLPNQTKNYNGGWSLYDGEKMTDYPQVGNGEANQVAYSLFCLKEVVFENGSVWSNPEYDNFFQTYAGKQIDIDTLQNYYPYTYNLEADKDL